MTDENLDFKSEQASSVADKVDKVADRISAVLSKMSQAESELWGCWGTGDSGRQFAYGENNNGYIAGAKNQREVLESYPEFLSGDKGYAPEFRKAAEVLKAMEDGNEAEMKRVGKINI